MTSEALQQWQEANQRYLMAALGEVRRILERRIERAHDKGRAPLHEDHEALREAAGAMPAPSALDSLSATFGLSPFERQIVLLCAGVELDSSFGALLSSLHGDPLRPYPTFGLALATLPDAHWSALTPVAPLRYWHLIGVGNSEVLTMAVLRIEERILHYLTGVAHMDERISGVVEAAPGRDDLVPTHRAIAGQLGKALSHIGDGATPPVIQLCGEGEHDKVAIAASASAELGLNLYRISVQALSGIPADLDLLIRLWEREAALSASALYLDCGELDPNDAPRVHALTRLAERLQGVLIVGTRDRRLLLRRPLMTLDVRKPTADEQCMVWHEALGSVADSMNGWLDYAVSQFDFTVQSIQRCSSETLGRLACEDRRDSLSPDQIRDTLWETCKVQARPRLDDLAMRIDPAASWDDLVLTGVQKQLLREITAHVRHRRRVYEEWGFSEKSKRGLGISALFTGESGTGKTMASEVLARDLRLDLYRIDLSQVVSKYIGETEKNLRRIFDAAEDGGVILLFDEADALFGKRSEIRDSHDRYANIEISYLLQRMETYRGLSILTTNMKSALDGSFLRRIRFVVHFPFPDAAERTEIWRRIFPPHTPREGLDFDRLGRLNVAGGNIRNIALNAAFIASEAGEPVRMKHLLSAAHSEYLKIEKPLSAAEISGWV